MEQYRYALWTDFFQDSAIIQSDDEVVAQKLGRKVKIVEDGWESEITDAAIHPQNDWFAWKEYRERLTRDDRSWLICNYYLHIVVDGRETLKWSLETYNPFFGCWVDYFMWDEDRLVMVYHEKHDYYGVSCSVSKVEQFVELAPHGAEAAVRDNVLYVYFPYTNAAEPLRRYALPSLVELDAISTEYAVDQGILVARQAS